MQLCSRILPDHIGSALCSRPIPVGDLFLLVLLHLFVLLVILLAVVAFTHFFCSCLSLAESAVRYLQHTTGFKHIRAEQRRTAWFGKHHNKPTPSPCASAPPLPRSHRSASCPLNLSPPFRRMPSRRLTKLVPCRYLMGMFNRPTTSNKLDGAG